MASQSSSGGGSWSAYMSDLAFRHGWSAYVEGRPFDYEVWRTLAPEIDLQKHPGVAKALQATYEHGRHMAAETKMPLPAPARRVTNEMKAVVRAAPALRKQFATEQALAREEARRAASLRMKMMHHQKRAA